MSRFKKKMEEYERLEQEMDNMSTEELEALIPRLKKEATTRISGGIILFIACVVALFFIRW